MDKKIAEELLGISTNCTRDLNESIKAVRDKCDDETFKTYRGYCGKIMGYLFTEIIAPIQSEHAEFAPPGFEAMEVAELPTLKLTKVAQGELLETLNQIYIHIGAMADVVGERCGNVETALYRSRMHQVLVHVCEAMVCVLAAHIVTD